MEAPWLHGKGSDSLVLDEVTHRVSGKKENMRFQLLVNELRQCSKTTMISLPA